MSIYLLGWILLLPVSQQRTSDTITFHHQRRSAPQFVPFTFPSPSTGSSFTQPLPAFPQQQFNNVQFAPPVSSLDSRQSSKNASTNQPLPQPENNNGFSIPTAMLSLALDMGRCNADNDCASNTVFSPLSIASALTMLLMGELQEQSINLASQ